MKKCWLNGKTFIISGASSGLGRGIAEKLIVNHGCNVIGIGRSREKFDNFISSLGAHSKNLSVELFDVTQKENWIALKDKLTSQGVAIDGIVNCAGILPPFKKGIYLTDSEAEKVMNANFLSCIYSINALYPTISASDTPTIINVASSASLATIVGTSIYSASKSALKSYTEALIYELKGKAYVSLVMPGFARTDIFRAQNSEIKSNKLFMMMSMPADKMVNKIYRGIKRKRTRAVYGKDAHLMNFFYRLAPRLTMFLISKILKKANVELFKDVFTD